VLTASDRLARQSANPSADNIEEVHHLYAVSMVDILMFGTFVYLGYRNRFRPVVHKRLMLFATFSLLDAAFDRWPVFDPYPLPIVTLVCFAPLVLLIIGYDWWSTRRVQRVTLWSALFPAHGAAGSSSAQPDRCVAELRGLGAPAHAVVLLRG